MKVIVNVEVELPDTFDLSTDEGYEAMEYAAKNEAKRVLNDNEGDWYVTEVAAS